MLANLCVESHLRELLEQSARRHVSSYNFALIYTGLGDQNEAFRWLNRAYDERAVRLMNLTVHPRFASLRSDPRFKALVARIGLPALQTDSPSK